MLGRLGLNFSPDDEYMEGAVFDIGVSKLLVKEQDLHSCIEFLQWRHLNHDIKI